MSNPDAPSDFLDDPEFLNVVKNRVEMIMVQKLGEVEVVFREVSVEKGAQILACYSFCPQPEIDVPDRFKGKHDVKGTRVWFMHDPLLKNKEILIHACKLIATIRAETGRNVREHIGHFWSEEIAGDEEFAQSVLHIDGSSWMFLAEHLRSNPAYMLEAIRSDKHIFTIIAREYPALMTAEMAEEAVKQDGINIRDVPTRLLTDDLLSHAVETSDLGGSHLPFAARWLEREQGIPSEQTWSNRERTIKAVGQWPRILKQAPAWCLVDDDCIAAAAKAVRKRPMEMSELPKVLQCHDVIVAAFIEGLPLNTSAYDWLCDEAKEHPLIVKAAKELRHP